MSKGTTLKGYIVSPEFVTYRHWIKKAGRGNFKKVEVFPPITVENDQVLITEGIVDFSNPRKDKIK